MLPTNSAPVQLRVLAASTGVCYPISLHPSDLSVATLRQRLAAAVPPQDQILLLGPPYKVPRDSTLRSEEILASLRLGDEEDGFGQGQGSPPRRTSSGDSSSVEPVAPRRCTLSTTEKTGARRLFLFSKHALSESSPDPPPCVLEPMALTLPTEPDPSPVSSLGPAVSPLHQALEVYERGFMLNLCRGRALADGADLRISACQKCVAEQSVMARALRAAVSNLSDHRNNATRAMTEFTTDFQSKTGQHAEMLCGFEGLLSSLAEEKLHPALISIAKRSGRMVETLLDTVPVERERAWAGQCQTAHGRLLSLFQELERSFAQIGNSSSWEEEARGDMVAEEEIKKLTGEVEDDAMEIRKRQVQRLDQLTNYHGEVVRVVMSAISGSSSVEKSQSQSTAQSAFSVLEEMSQASTDILPSMVSDDTVLAELMTKVAEAKTGAMKRMRTRLREISRAQSTIQRVLSSISVLRDTLAQQCENMVHLEHVSQLKSCYQDFLSEIRRRRAYGGAVSSTMEAMIERMAAMRVDEVKSRERFLRSSGRHLMPAFYEIFAPTLASPPPIFAPQLPATIEMDSLPDVGMAVGSSTAGGSASTEECTSNLTLSSNDPLQEGAGEAGATARVRDQKGVCEETAEEGGMKSGAGLDTVMESASTKTLDEPTASTPSTAGAGATASGRTGADSSQDQQGLIVSADETSSNEIMASYHDQRKASEAERKTLAYENAVLRQAVERMGGKPPRTYVEEAKAKDDETQKKLEKKELRKTKEASKAVLKENETLALKMEKMEKDLARAKSKAKEAEAILAKTKKKSSSDKISHSSFEVGDVGLFMPTGRGILGKRTYLAFHSNCPHRYLSTDSVEGTPDYVLGRIVYQEEHTAGPMGGEANPYGLHPGTRFWVLTVEVIKVP